MWYLLLVSRGSSSFRKRIYADFLEALFKAVENLKKEKKGKEKRFPLPQTMATLWQQWVELNSAMSGKSNKRRWIVL